MNTMLKGVLAVAILSVPGLAAAQTGDAAYCRALVARYEHYLGAGQRYGAQPQSLKSRAALAECQAGDASGIPGLEQALHNARIDLPSRTAAGRTVPATDGTAPASGKCGPETWSTDKMMYVGVPCGDTGTSEAPAR